MHYQKLNQYLPEDAIPIIEKWFSPYSIKLRITNNRKTKLGDYRKMDRIHYISVNGDLSKEAFFFVLTHEFAHLKTYASYSNKRIAPHGIEWKTIFSQLLQESISVYSLENKPLVHNHSLKPKASVSADPQIAKHLLHTENAHEVYLEDLNYGDYFQIGNKILQKGNKRKIRYLCEEYKTGRKYLVNGLAMVNLINNEKR